MSENTKKKGNTARIPEGKKRVVITLENEVVEAIQKIAKGWEYEKHWWKTYFDDPRDNEAVKLGIEYYYKL